MVSAASFGHELVRRARIMTQPRGIVVLFDAENKLDEKKRLREQGLQSGASLQLVVSPFRCLQESHLMKDVFLAAAPIERWQVYDVVKEIERTIAPPGPWQEWESSLLCKAVDACKH